MGKRCLIAKNIEELKQSVEEKASAVKRAEEGAADLKKRVDELSKSLEDHEKEYQVTAGGKLFNVVVDTKYWKTTTTEWVQQAAARKVGKENAEVALSLVGYEEELKPDPAIKKSSVMPRAINMHSMLLRSH
ncbi:hypothetical protein RIF29_00342 [Crotalaria pallida]|uniref:Uncharacterized protein n=1 Tax=Crotalaria pallida TaxID=3830 RepID=A0AAN9P6J5_CROPI